MLRSFLDYLRARKEIGRFFSLRPEQRNIVFYSEDDFSIVHFEGMLEQLRKLSVPVCYLTSQSNDPILETDDDLLRTFYVGIGLSRTSLFINLKADVLVMTMPDLENYHIKRSKVFPVHYVYVFHAMVSTHSNYRQGAFNHFDTVYLTGPYQEEEIRQTERVYQLPKKQLIPVGYYRLEQLLFRISESDRPDPARLQEPTIIIAPSWGPNSILEALGCDIIRLLLKENYRVVVRPHPATTRRCPELIESIEAEFSESTSFELQTNVADRETLYSADLMISDWSGVGMEFAFTCERPVIYINLPKKSFNSEENLISIEPIEVSIREQIGSVLEPEELDKLPELIENILSDPSSLLSDIRELRDEYVFNLGNSSEVAVDHLTELAKQRRAENEKHILG
jgi:YidC/Oxa1 family membrane protein insertase